MVFVKDITIGEGESIPPNTTFVKTWRVQNPGPDRWPPGCILRWMFVECCNRQFYCFQYLIDLQVGSSWHLMTEQLLNLSNLTLPLVWKHQYETWLMKYICRYICWNDLSILSGNLWIKMEDVNCHRKLFWVSLVYWTKKIVLNQFYFSESKFGW